MVNDLGIADVEKSVATEKPAGYGSAPGRPVAS
jgi:hypothetical protein